MFEKVDNMTVKVSKDMSSNIVEQIQDFVEITYE